MGWGSVKGKVKQTEDTSVGHCRRHCEANRPLRHDFIQVRGEVIGQQDQGICLYRFIFHFGDTDFGVFLPFYPVFTYVEAKFLEIMEIL